MLPLSRRFKRGAIRAHETPPNNAPGCVHCDARRCQNAATCLQIHYMYGATFGQQTKHLREWIEADEAAGPKPVKLDYILSVMFWIAVPYVSQASIGILSCSRRGLHGPRAPAGACKLCITWLCLLAQMS